MRAARTCFSSVRNTTAPKAVIFDKDGTLIDAHATWAPLVAEAVARYTTVSNDANAHKIYTVLGLDATSMTFGNRSVFMTDSNETCRRRLDQHGIDALLFYRGMDQVCEEMLGSHITPLFDINALFDKLRNVHGVQVGMLTADDRTNVQQLLDRTALTLDVLGCGDDGKGWKPSGDPLVAMAAELGLHPSEMIMVGDSTHDVDAGIDAGTVTVGVETGVGSKTLLGHADFVVASAEDVCEVVEQLLNGEGGVGRRRRR